MAALPLLGALLVLLAALSTARPLSVSAAPRVVEVRLGVLLPGRNLDYPWAWPRVKPALSLALEALQAELRHAGLVVRTAFNSTEDEDGACSYEETLRRATDMKISLDPDVLLGLGCPGTSLLGRSFAHYWQLPILRAGDYRRDSSLSRTMVYAGPGGPDHSVFMAQLHQRFNWTSRAVGVFSPEAYHWWWQQYYPLMSFDKHLADNPNFTGYFHYYGEPGKAVQFIQANGRVVYIFGSPEMLQDIMYLAQDQNMTSGDYVFVYVDISGESLEAGGHHEAAKPWQSKKSQDMGGFREAFQTVLVVTSHGLQTPEYRRFHSQVILRAQRDFGVALNDSLGTLVAGCFHDVLLLYLRALNETLCEGGTKRDTSRILGKMRGLKIQGVTGTVSINNDNERETDYDLWAMKDVESGEYQVVAHYVGSEKQIKWLGPIPWKKGGPPLDNPACVFDMDDPSCGADARPPTVWISRACTDPPRMDAAPRQPTARH